MTQEEYVLCYVERYGIINYRVKDGKIIFNVSYPAYLSNPRVTYQHIHDIKTGKEVVKQLKRYDKGGEQNR